MTAFIHKSVPDDPGLLQIHPGINPDDLHQKSRALQQNCREDQRWGLRRR